MKVGSLWATTVQGSFDDSPSVPDRHQTANSYGLSGNSGPTQVGQRARERWRKRERPACSGLRGRLA